MQWDHRLIAIDPRGGGVHRLTFANGLSTEADLVIGADAAWPQVRRLLSGAVPGYTGVTFIETGLDEVDIRHRDCGDPIQGRD